MTFGVACDSDLFIGRQVDDEEFVFADEFSDASADRFAWGDESSKADQTSIVHDTSDVCGSSEVFASIFDRVSEVLVNPVSHFFTVEDHHRAALVEQGAFDGSCDG